MRWINHNFIKKKQNNTGQAKELKKKEQTRKRKKPLMTKTTITETIKQRIKKNNQSYVKTLNSHVNSQKFDYLPIHNEDLKYI